MIFLEQVVLTALAIWFVFFLINHADLTAKVRNALMPALPRWLSYPLQCAICFSFWLLAAFSLFTGWNPLILCVPPVTLGIDLSFRRLQPTAPAAKEDGK